MPALGIQNFDRMLKRVEAMQKACREEARDKALEAAGDVLRSALETATPVGAGNARRSVINVPARQRQYGVTRRLIGYSKSAWYMFFIEKGWTATGSRRRARSGGGPAHSQRGVSGGTRISGRNFMASVFNSSIGRAMAAAREVIRKEAGF